MLSRDKTLALAGWLSEHHSLWSARPFYNTEPTWLAEYPALYRQLLQAPASQIQQARQNPEYHLQWLSEVLPSLHTLMPLLALPQAPQRDNSRFNPHFSNGIPGRKWQQIQAFMQSIPADSQVLDWCCGKGHLLRSLCYCKQCRGSGLEWQAELSSAGNTLAQKWQLDCNIKTGDALAPASAEYLKPDVHVIALHACGDLHTHLLDLLARHPVAAISLAPCCYHLTRAGDYPWRSRLLQSLDWRPDLHDLRLCVEESVTAPGQQLQQQHILQSWRLGFNALYSALYGKQAPLPEPRLNMTIIKQGFRDFCHTRAQDSDITLPGQVDFTYWQQQGELIQERVQRLELARHLARRAMETLLNADKTHYLQDLGMHADLYEFCPRPLSPRNMLIQGIYT